MATTTMARPQDWREARRLRAAELHARGWTQAAIADALGVTQGAVSQWLTRARAAGPAALRARKHPGPTPRLTPWDRAALRLMLVLGAEHWGFAGDLWTLPRVATLIERGFGVRYHPAHVCRVLRDLGWTSQLPARRATQRDEAAIAAWLRAGWPALKKGRGSSAVRSSS